MAKKKSSKREKVKPNIEAKSSESEPKEKSNWVCCPDRNNNKINIEVCRKKRTLLNAKCRLCSHFKEDQPEDKPQESEKSKSKPKTKKTEESKTVKLTVLACSQCGKEHDANDMINCPDGTFLCFDCAESEAAEEAEPNGAEVETTEADKSKESTDVGEKAEEAREEARTKAVQNYTEKDLPSVEGDPASLEDAVRKLKGYETTFAAHAYQIGRTLMWIKDQVGHGNFQEWVGKNLWFSARTARRFMAFSTQCDEEQTLLDYNGDGRPHKKKDTVVGRKREDWMSKVTDLVTDKHWRYLVNDFLTPGQRDERDAFLNAVRTLYDQFVVNGDKLAPIDI